MAPHKGVLKFFTMFLLVSSMNSWGSDDVPLRLSLSDALMMAKEKHVTILVAQERVQQALARIGESRSVLLPQIQADISQKRQTRDLRTSGISFAGDPLVGPFNAYDARVKLTQTIFDPAAIARLEATRDAQHESLSEYRKARQDALALVATFFIDAKRASEYVQLTKILLHRDQKRLRIIQNRFQNGLASDLEVKQAKANYTQSLSHWRTANTESIERRFDLTAALGISAQQSIVFVEDDQQKDFNFPSDIEVKRSLRTHPAIEVVQDQLQQKNKEHAAELAEYFPKISAFTDYGPSGIKPNDSSETYTLGVQASMPIFEGGLRQSRLKETQSRIKETQATLKDTQIHIEADVFKAKEMVKQAKTLLKEANENLNVAKQEFDLAKRRLNKGIGSELELMDAFAELALARDQKKEVMATYQMAQINLTHALGTIDQLVTIK